MKAQIRVMFLEAKKYQSASKTQKPGRGPERSFLAAARGTSPADPSTLAHQPPELRDNTQPVGPQEQSWRTHTL